MNRRLSSGILTLVALCVFPIAASASTIFSMSGATGSSITGTGSAESVVIDWNSLFVGATQYAGTYVETYLNTGTLTITENGSTILSIDEAPNLAGTFNGTAVSLYSAATSLTIYAPLLGELGLVTSPALSKLSAASFNVTASGSGSNTATSETSSFTLTTTTPEPSTFALFGLTLLSLAGYSIRKRLA